MTRSECSTSRLGGLPSRGLRELAEVAELLVAPFEQVLYLEALKVAKGLGDELLKAVGGRVRIAMCAAQRLAHDRVDHPILLEVLAGELERLGRVGGVFGAFPEDAA